MNGGLERALHDALGAEPAWFCEYEPPKKPGGKPPRQAAAMILAHHWPDVPNHGDVTAVDWAAVEPVDIIAGGSPCQDLSPAGKRAGMRPGTRSGLWASMCDAIDTLRPSLVVWENVHGALSARAASDVEREPGRVGDSKRRPVLRALGRVLGDLAGLGYDAAWTGLRAADIGAPHGRFRIFVVAWPTADPGALSWPTADPGALLPTPVVNDMGAAYSPDEWDEWTARLKVEHGNGNGHGASLSVEALRLLPSPRTSDTNGAGVHGEGGLDLRTAVSLLPTPRATRGGSATETMALLPTPMTAYTSSTAEEWRARRPAGNGGVRERVGDLRIVTEELLPTPTAGDAKSSRNSTATRYVLPPTGVHAGDTLTDAVVPKGDVRPDFGQYAPAIARWEAITRPAPSPTEPTGRGGVHRLSPRFVEWMQGLSDGWVTGVPGITRNDQLKALGNGVVPQQGAEGIRRGLVLARTYALGMTKAVAS